MMLSAGEAPDFVTDQVATKRDWMEVQLSGLNVELTVISIQEHEILSGSEGDAWIITGSESSVCRPRPWMARLSHSIHNGISGNMPILGICFGHQILADILGGEVTRNPAGWEIGSVPIHLNQTGRSDPLFNDVDSPFIGYETHQDSVLKLPESCTLLAENHMGIQAFRYGDTVYGVQFHPEFRKAVMEAYVQFRIHQGFLSKADTVEDSACGQMVLRNFINML